MSNRYGALAQEIVSNFRDSLDESVRKEISQAQFDDLTIAIRTAFSDQLSDALGRIEEALRKLRTEIEPPELGL